MPRRTNPPVETEVKFTARGLNQAEFAASPLLANALSHRRTELRSIYFDTENFALARSAVSLRVRKRTGAAGGLMCVKAPGHRNDAFSRSEVEVKLRGLKPRLDLLDPETAARIGKLTGGEALEAKFESRISRWSCDLPVGTSILEVVFDEGHIVAGGRKLAVAEIEVEMKAGSEDDLFAFALQLSEKMELSLDLASKSEKGYRLARGEAAKAMKAEPVALAKDATLDDAIAAILSGTLTQFTGNWAALRETGTPEAVHQMRVALRRMRSALWMFRKHIPGIALSESGEEAKRIAAVLGPTRASDVFQADALNGPLAAADCPEGRDALLRAIGTHRAETLAAAQRLIDTAAATCFVLTLQHLIHTRGWRDGLAPDALGLLDAPARDAAAATLARLLKRIAKRGRRLAELDDAERHELRIDLKKLRYTTEFFIGLFRHGKRAKALLQHVAGLQDLLGAHNDVVTGRAFLDELRKGREAEIDRISGFILGWQARGVPLAEALLRDAWDDFEGVKPFWT